MRRLVWGTALALIALLVTGAIISGSVLLFSGEEESLQPESTSLKAASNEAGQKVPLPRAAAHDGEPNPYLGIAIHTITHDEAEELGIPGGAKVVRVGADGPSVGILEGGDIIVAINAAEVKTAKDVVHQVLTSEIGSTMSIEVLRDGQRLTLQVTVGSREHFVHIEPGFFRGFIRPPSHPLLRLLPLDGLRRIWRAEIIIGTDEGSKTLTAVAGTVKEVDAEADTLTLTPKDGSGDILYQLTDDIHILLSGQPVELGRVLTNDEAVVVSLDGEVKWVLVGPFALKPGFNIAPFSAPDHFRNFRPTQPRHKFRFLPGRGTNYMRPGSLTTDMRLGPL